MSEPEGILVPADSPFETLDDLVQAWTDDPGSIAVGGGSSPGGPDHLFPMQLADEIGIDPNDVNYVSYDGGGPLTSALLGEKIDVGFSGLAEFVGDVESGELRVLAVSGEERYPDGPFAEVPTLTESGVDLVFLNWRGVLAPPEISDERTEELIGYLEEMHDSQGWTGPAREERLDRRLQDRRRLRRVHRRAGRARVRDPRGAGAAVSEPAERHSRPVRRRTVDKAQYGLAAALLLVGVYTIIDARGLTVGFGDPIGPRVFPYLIGTGMVVLVGAARGGHLARRRRRGRGRRGRRPDLPGRLGHRRQAGRHPGAQPAAGEHPRLGDHRGAALRGLRLGAGQPHAASAT